MSRITITTVVASGAVGLWGNAAVGDCVQAVGSYRALVNGRDTVWGLARFGCEVHGDLRVVLLKELCSVLRADYVGLEWVSFFEEAWVLRVGRGNWGKVGYGGADPFCLSVKIIGDVMEVSYNWYHDGGWCCEYEGGGCESMGLADPGLWDWVLGVLRRWDFVV